jgi:2-dehydro-3-deoxygluconokinase
VPVEGAVVAFGELLLRLDPAGGVRLVQAGAFDARYTGAEANVAASLSGFGIATAVVSAVPDGVLGQACVDAVRRHGVDTSQVLRRPGRLGLLFTESGGAGRPPRVVYDRAGSVFATVEADAFDWAEILRGARWLHLSGTAPAVGPGAREAAGRAVATARDLGVPVSLDLNHRASLWSLAEATTVLGPLAKQVDVVLGVGDEAAGLLGFAPVDGDVIGRLDRVREATGARCAAGTDRTTGDDGVLRLRGVLVDESGAHVSRGYPVTDQVGRIGTGDAFAAGLLRGLLLAEPGARVVEFAAAAAHLKQSVTGDVNLVTVDEVERVIAGDVDQTAARIER